MSISHRCYLLEVAFEWEFTKETIHLTLGCLQGGSHPPFLVCGPTEFFAEGQSVGKGCQIIGNFMVQI